MRAMPKIILRKFNAFINTNKEFDSEIELKEL